MRPGKREVVISGALRKWKLDQPFLPWLTADKTRLPICGSVLSAVNSGKCKTGVLVLWQAVKAMAWSVVPDYARLWPMTRWGRFQGR